MSIKDEPDRDPVPPDAPEAGTLEEAEETPLVPGLSSWKPVYWLVLAFFVLCVVLMRALQEFYS
jgi:hypothetical protein